MSRPPMTQSRLIVLLVMVLAVAATAVGCGRTDTADKGDADLAKQSKDTVLTPEAVDAAAAKRAAARQDRSQARVVQLEGAGQKKTYGPAKDYVSPGAPTDAEIKADLKQAHAQLAKFRKSLDNGTYLQTGPQAKVLPNGTAVAPEDAPEAVKRVIQAGNLISKFPYKWGGGHGAWRDNGYDCSGSVSFALAGAGLLKSPLTSGAFAAWGDEGPGDWITIYANGGHVYMYVAGLRFDTSGRGGRTGTRWQDATRSGAGFSVRHPPSL